MRTRQRQAKEKEPTPVGERIKAERDKKQWTQKDLAERMEASQEAISKWESGDRLIKAEDVIKLASVFGIDCHYLLTKEHPENMTALSELGLSDQAISTLKDWTRNASQHPQYSAGLIIDESENGEPETANIISPRETLETLNLLLETLHGWRLLSLIYRFCFADFDKPTQNEQPIDTKIDFPNRPDSQEGTTYIYTRMLRFATMKAIETELENLRNCLIEREEAKR